MHLPWRAAGTNSRKCSRNGCFSACRASCQCRSSTAWTSWFAKLPDAAPRTDLASGFHPLTSANGIRRPLRRRQTPAHAEGTVHRPCSQPASGRHRHRPFGQDSSRFRHRSGGVGEVVGRFEKQPSPGAVDAAPGPSNNVRKTYGTKPISRKSPGINCRHFWPACDASGTDSAAPGGLFDPEMILQDGIVVPGVGALAGMSLRDPCGLPLEGFLTSAEHACLLSIESCT